MPSTMISPMEHGALSGYHRGKYSSDALNKLGEFFGMGDNPMRVLEWEED